MKDTVNTAVRETLQSRLTKSLALHQSMIAIEHGKRKWTYEQLDRKSELIAGWIRHKYARQTMIGVHIDDRIELIAWMVGIFKAGAIFVPLDGANPVKRILEMIEHIQLPCVIADDHRASILRESETETTIHPLSEVELELGQMTSEGTGDYDINDKVYVYFTSGSSGKPKAVLGRNRSLLHFLDWEISTFQLNCSFTFSQFTTPGFDVFLRDVLVPLCCGGKIVVPESLEILLDSRRLLSWANANNIRFMHVVPSLFRLINNEHLTSQDLPKLQYVLLAGEKIVPAELANWYEKMGERVQLVNLYGPTETTLAKCCYFIQKSDVNRDIMPIGQPIKGARVIIVNDQMEICDTLISGEMYIRTPYRSFGYVNDPEMNRQKFIPNPFSSDPDDLVYKSGDLARMLPDGNIELLGRADRQVKIRGVRIELEEIESRLHRHALIREAAVIQNGESSDTAHIVAIVVPVESAGTSVGDAQRLEEQIRSDMSLQVLEQMVPARIMAVTALPRLANGKINYIALKEGYLAQAEMIIKPRNEIETQLHAIWTRLLGKQELSVDASFFKSGGNSLNMMKLIAEISKGFGMNVTLSALFSSNTIEKQANLIAERCARLQEVEFMNHPVNVMNANKDTSEVTRNEAHGLERQYPLSHAQKRLFIIEKMYGPNTMYNMCEAIEIRGEIDMPSFNRAFAQLVERHEMLRASFALHHEQPMQTIQSTAEFTVERLEADGRSVEQIVDAFVRPFDLSKPPLIRAGLLRLEQHKYLLLLDMHHIVTDAYSFDVLVQDFVALYSGGSLVPLQASYTDFALWQNSAEFASCLERQQQYWLDQFADGVPEMHLPTDKQHDGESRSIRSSAMKAVDFHLEEKELHLLLEMNRKHDSTLFMSLLALFAVWLHKVTGHTDLVIGTPASGRIEERFEHVVGMFVNSLAIRNRIEENDSFVRILQQVRSRVLQALEHQDYPFDDLVRNVCGKRDMHKNPIFKVMFQLHEFDLVNAEIEGLMFERLDLQTESHFDLRVVASRQGKGVEVSLLYNEQLISRPMAEKWKEQFATIVHTVLHNQDICMKDIVLLSESELEDLEAILSVADQMPEIRFDF